MKAGLRACLGVMLTVVAIVQVTLHADTVQLSFRDGRLSLVATNATPSQIFAAWSRAGGVLVVNAERMPATPVTLRLDNITEEQALDTLLRPVSGYLAQRRAVPRPDGSAFDRIVIFASPSMAQPVPAAVNGPRGAGSAAPVFAQPTVRPAAPVQAPPASAPAPAGIPLGPGVVRLVGPDGQPVEDDQADAPVAPYNGGDVADPRPPGAPPRGTAPASPPAQPAPPSTSAPVGVPRPGMAVPDARPTPPR
ncbi:MAG TPA: hypothetical protein VM032_04450 [Vicinamibacterales bacterium]|nr:hypothetical protein [Vicinamibacterales bacterium]